MSEPEFTPGMRVRTKDKHPAPLWPKSSEYNAGEPIIWYGTFDRHGGSSDKIGWIHWDDPKVGERPMVLDAIEPVGPDTRELERDELWGLI